MPLLRRLTCLWLLVVAGVALAAPPPVAVPMRLHFDGVEYLHRWSKDGQNEFTPAGQENLDQWRDMVTVDVHPKVADGAQLADLANGVLGNYRNVGKIIRVDSRPRTKDHEAEHLVVAVLGAPGVLEAAFARILLVDGQGVAVVVSHREYGPDAADTMGQWLEAHGGSVEVAVMGWDAIPRPADLATLPQAKP